MSANDLELIHNKLDKMLDHIVKLQVITAELSEHQRSINGTVARHEIMFNEEKKITNELIKDFKENSRKKIEDIDRRIDENKLYITKAQGITIGIGILATVIGVIATSKSLGLW